MLASGPDTARNLGIAAGLFLLAGVFRLLDSMLPPFPSALCFLMTSFLYIGLTFAWGISVFSRTLQRVCMQADILLMEAGRLEAYTLDNRFRLIDRVREKIPGCKFALLCDENSDRELARQVKIARQNHLIDAFFYASVTPGYLTAAVEAP